MSFGCCQSLMSSCVILEFSHLTDHFYSEKTNSNAVETYTRMTNKGHDIDIDFKYNEKEDPFTSKLKKLPQKGYLPKENPEQTGNWKVSPFWPIKMPYQIIECDTKDYMYSVIGYPSRDYCWVLYRYPVMPDDLYQDITKRLVDSHQYSLDGLRKVPQRWTKEEREKRGLTAKEIPDNMLEKN